MTAAVDIRKRALAKFTVGDDCWLWGAHCVRPNHLEPVTHKMNMERSINATKSACKRGHEFNEENTRIYRGWRHCRICQRAHGDAWYKANGKKSS